MLTTINVGSMLTIDYGAMFGTGYGTILDIVYEAVFVIGYGVLVDINYEVSSIPSLIFEYNFLLYPGIIISVL